MLLNCSICLFYGTNLITFMQVDGREGSVLCPDSVLALKVAVLKQAAVLAMKEQTTVRIPIPVNGETEAFGVYAVPGLETHVFVGPFTAKNTAAKTVADVICLDDDDVTEMEASKPVEPESHREQPDAGNDDDDDDIQEVFPEKAPEKSNDSFMRIGDLPTLPAPGPKVDRQKLMSAQIPRVVTSNVGTDNDVEIIDLDEENGEEQVEVFNAGKKNYVNVQPSQFGRVIFRDDSRASAFADDNQVASSVDIPNYGKLKVRVLPDRVLFRHPTFYRHEVVCSNLDLAKSWMLEFLETNKNVKAKLSSVNPGESKPSVTDPVKTGSGTGLQNVPARPKQHPATVFQNGDQKSAAILIDRRKMREKFNFFSSLAEVIISFR